MAQNDDMQDADVRLEAGGQAHAPAAAQDGPPTVLLSRAAQETIRQHANSDLTHEVGGVLVGVVIDSPDGPIVDIETALPAQDADTSAIHITFTHEAWEHWHKLMDESYAGKMIVGWYHSHPSYGIFLSGDDTFIQQNFFNQPWQIAIVIDPVRKEIGTFGWVGGKITRCDEATYQSLERKAAGAESQEPATPAEPVMIVDLPSRVFRLGRIGWLGWGVAAAFFVFCVLQTFGEMRMIKHLRAVQGQVDALTSTVHEEIAEVQRQAAATRNPNGQWYVWQTGDTWEGLSARMYGRADLGEVLARVNGTQPEAAAVGGHVWLPGRAALMPPQERAAPAKAPAGP